MAFSAGATAGLGLSTGATLGIAAGVIAAEEIIRHYVGRGRKAADAWVKGGNGQNDFLKNVLEPAAEIAKTDPEKAAALTEEGWKTYLQGADEYASKGAKQSLAVQQNLFKTPDFMNTVGSLMGKDPLGADFTSGFVAGPTDQGLFKAPKYSLGSILANAAKSAVGIQPSAGQTTLGLPAPTRGTSSLSLGGSMLGLNNPTSLGNSLMPQTGQSGSVGWLGPTTGIPQWAGPLANLAGTIINGRRTTTAPTTPTIGRTPPTFPSGTQSGGGTSGGAPTGGGGFGLPGTNPVDPNQQGGHWWDRFIDPSFLLGVGTSVAGGILNSRAATNAGNAQAAAAQQAAQLQAQTAANSLGFAQQVYNNQQAANAPFLAAGTNALGTIQGLIGPGGDLSKDYTLPTIDAVRQSPGYQLELDEAQKALARSTRGVTSGATIKAATRLPIDYADAKYDSFANRDMNVFQTNRSNRLNPLFTLAGFGPQAVGANNAAGNQASNSVTGINSNLADNVGSLGLNAAAARAGGNVDSTNALVQALAQISNLAQQRQAQTRSSY